MSFADCFNSNCDVIVENFAQRRQWQILETSLLKGNQDYQLQSPQKHDKKPQFLPGIRKMVT